MRNRTLSLFVAAGFGLFNTAAFANPNLVWNPDFEGGTHVDTGPGSNNTGDVLPDDWLLGPPSTGASKVNTVTTNSAPLGPESGTHYLQYQSAATVGEDCIWQDITTIPGGKYIFSYYVDDTAPTGAGSVSFNAVWDENTLNAHSYNLDPNAANSGPTGYILGPGPGQTSVIETASTNLTRIDFHAIDSNGSILLDNISVVAVPEPAALSLLTLAGISLMTRRRRV